MYIKMTGMTRRIYFVFYWGNLVQVNERSKEVDFAYGQSY